MNSKLNLKTLKYFLYYYRYIYIICMCVYVLVFDILEKMYENENKKKLIIDMCM